MSDYTDRQRELGVDYLLKEFNGVIVKEKDMARETGGIKPESSWLKLEDGDFFEGVYRGYDREQVDSFGNIKFYFEINGIEKEYSQASKNRSFLAGIDPIGDGQKVRVGRTGTGKETKYIITRLD